jgi:hypothetical protein
MRRRCETDYGYSTYFSGKSTPTIAGGRARRPEPATKVARIDYDFDSIDNSAYILGKAKHSARDSWVYTDGETFAGVRADIGGDPDNPDVKIAWKYLYTAKDTPGSGQRRISAPSARSTT